MAFLFFSLLILIAGGTSVSAQDTSLVDLDAQQTRINWEYKTFSSCQAMTKTINDFYQKIPLKMPVFYDRGRIPEAAMMENSAAAPTARQVATPDVSKSSDRATTNTDFSTTNNQIAGVQEPEILKSNGRYLFHANNKNKIIAIILTPLDMDAKTINLDRARIVNTIKLPDQLWMTNLLLTNDRLVIIGTRNSQYWSNKPGWIDRSSRTLVAVYDISDVTKLKLISFRDIDGNYDDARLVGHRLTLLTQSWINWYRTWNEREKKSLTANDIVPFSYDKVRDSKLTITRADCQDMSFLLPEFKQDQIPAILPNFLIISHIDISQWDILSTTTILGTKEGMHMNANDLYITASQYTPRWSCPFGARCIMPRFDEGTQTLIHKFALPTAQTNKMTYTATTMVPGTPLSQYSMDADANWNFRILTRKSRRDGTNFFVLNPNLEKRGEIIGIEPGEEFKSSRYMGDKLYLVTFEQTDPLFVIDIANPAKPAIIGKLKIPWFSTYLHPFPSPAGKQYLVWLGYDTATAQRGWTVQSGVKVSLYEIDYTKPQTVQAQCDSIKHLSGEHASCVKDFVSWGIFVREVDHLIFGWQWSYADVLDNPRTFVIDAQGNVSLSLMEMSQEKTGEQCNIIRMADGTTREENCRPQFKNILQFWGIQQVAVSTDGLSQGRRIDYRTYINDQYKGDGTYEDIRTWELRTLNPRVWFVSDILYFINDDFASFVDTDGKHKLLPSK